MNLPPPPSPRAPSGPSSGTLTCYRHPDREAGRRCTRCGKPACSDCLVQATVGSHCVDCVRQAQPNVRERVKMANARQPVLVTMIIIAINVAVFAWVAVGDASTIFSGFGGGHPSERQVQLGLSRGIMVLTPDHDWYRLITNGFLHFGVIHIAFNMYLLWLLGNLLEPALGRVKFALLYFASLLGGSAGVLILSGVFDPSISGGASGAVFGLMGAAAIAMHQRGANIFQTPIGRLLILNLVLTFLIPNISKGGHVGGLIAGTICGAIMLAPNWKRVSNWARYATPIIVMLVS